MPLSDYYSEETLNNLYYDTERHHLVLRCGTICAVVGHFDFGNLLCGLTEAHSLMFHTFREENGEAWRTNKRTERLIRLLPTNHMPLGFEHTYQGRQLQMVKDTMDNVLDTRRTIWIPRLKSAQGKLEYRLRHGQPRSLNEQWRAVTDQN